MGVYMPRKSKKFGQRLTVSLTDSDYDALSALADKDDASVSWVIRRAIDEYLDRHVSNADDRSARHVAR